MRAKARWHRRAPVLASWVALLVGLVAVPLGAPAHADRVPPSEPAIAGPVAGWPEAPEVTAEAFVLVDAETGQVLAEQRSRQRRPVASTIKVLTALTVLDRADVDDVVEVGDEVEVGGASVGLEPGDEWTIEQLLDGLLIRSGNDAAEALAAHVAGDLDAFIELMAQDAAALGLEDLTLTSVSGLDDGNLLSAADLASLARVALDDEQLRPLLGRARSSLPGVGEVVNRNELLEAYPDATGVKTGYTQAAGYSLVASARRDGRELVAVVLASDEDPARFQDAAALLDHGFEDYRSETMSTAIHLLVGGGAHEVSVPAAPVVVPSDAAVALALGPPARPEPGSLSVGLEVDGEVLGTVTGDVGEGPEPVTGGAVLGRALADGAYAGMRAATAEDAW
jgi:serine-type D-Ala-D-Ala carboxypeptidase (penicillin-binding protein 5/6)